MKTKGRGRKNAVQNVRIVDPLSGTDGLKVDRQLSALQNAAGHVQLLCNASLSFDSASADANDTITWGSIAQSDEFKTMAAQFLTFRIRSIRFDVYDLSPNTAGSAYFSTFHDVFSVASPPTFAFNDVVDGADSGIVPPGTGKASWTWMGHTTGERSYYRTTIADPSQGADFGGLRLTRFQGPQVGVPRWRVAVKAVVDFRGRK